MNTVAKPRIRTYHKAYRFNYRRMICILLSVWALDIFAAMLISLIPVAGPLVAIVFLVYGEYRRWKIGAYVKIINSCKK